MSGLESTASRVLAPDFYAEIRFSTLWHTQRKCVRICWVSINCRQKTAKYGRGKSQYAFHVISLRERRAEQIFFTLREREESKFPGLRDFSAFHV